MKKKQGLTLDEPSLAAGVAIGLLAKVAWSSIPEGKRLDVLEAITEVIEALGKKKEPSPEAAPRDTKPKLA